MTITGDHLMWVLGFIVLFGAACAVVWRWLKPFRALASRTNEFLDDWFGTPERPGVPARAGVMPRLATVEEEVVELAREVASKATVEELAALRAELEAHITRSEARRGLRTVEDESG